MIEGQPKLICIIGTDGVGKTTHVQELLNQLKNNGMRCKYVWFRFHHFISLFLLAYCRLVNLTIYENKDGEKICHHEFYRSRAISFIYPWLLFVDTVPMYIIKISIPLFFGYTIVCDRFVYDTLVDLMIDLRKFDIHKKFIGKLFINMIPKNSCVILLDIDESIIRERRKDLINDQSLNMRRTAYKTVAKEFDIPTIENNVSFQEVHEQIIKYLGDKHGY